MQMFPIEVDVLDGNEMDLGVLNGPGAIRDSVRLHFGMPIAGVIDHTNLTHAVLLIELTEGVSQMRKRGFCATQLASGYYEAKRIVDCLERANAWRQLLLA
jgi:hypothetical protein